MSEVRALDGYSSNAPDDHATHVFIASQTVEAIVHGTFPALAIVLTITPGLLVSNGSYG